LNRLKARVIAYYLPQYHPIPENNEWWGPGFTEWTNVAKAKPLFPGHNQPNIPADLGFYDLRNSETRELQAALAKEAGIEGFCYWHYWFGNGRQLLERPFDEVVKSGKPDYPFCVGWANEAWKAKVWSEDKYKKDKTLIDQLYPGDEDNELHFYSLQQAFLDKRYIRVDQKPFFLIYKPLQFSKLNEFIKQWNELARSTGLSDGFYFVGQIDSIDQKQQLEDIGFDAVTFTPRIASIFLKQKGLAYLFKKIKRKLFSHPLLISYEDASEDFVIEEEDSIENVIPSIIPNWDHSPRSNNNALVLHESTPDLFRKNIIEALKAVEKKLPEHKIIILKSWNEWGEGNYIEPDLKFGKQYLEVLQKELG
jgi:lipopolysaccharide biosynthesis protein